MSVRIFHYTNDANTKIFSPVYRIKWRTRANDSLMGFLSVCCMQITDLKKAKKPVLLDVM